LTGNPQSELELGWQYQLSDLVTGLCCAPDGRGWAASSAAGEVVWNAGSSQIVSLQSADGHSIADVAFSADGRWLAAGGQAGKLFIWDCRDLQLVQTLAIDRWIEHLVWHPSQPTLAIGYGNRVKVWDMMSHSEVTTWQFPKSSIFDLAWHPGGVKLAVAGYKGVEIWSPSELTAPSERLDVATATIAIAWSADGRYLAAGNLDRTLTMMDRQQLQDCWTLQGCPGKIRQLAWIAATETPCLAVASGTTIVLWDASADATTWDGRLLAGHQDVVTVTISDPHAPSLASGGADGYTCLWAADGEILQILSQPIFSGFTKLSWHPDRLYLATGTQTGEICLWSIPA
jgi:WD40 repeat protein